MTAVRRSLVVALAVVLAPVTALACPTCVSSAFGDRTYNWAYVGLLLMPFALMVVIGGILAWRAGYGAVLAERLSMLAVPLSFGSRNPGSARGRGGRSPHTATDTERT